jgi:hypothetical protein
MSQLWNELEQEDFVDCFDDEFVRFVVVTGNERQIQSTLLGSIVFLVTR